MRILRSLALTLLLFTIVFASDPQNPTQTPSVTESEIEIRPNVPPKLSLRRALTLAERELQKRKPRGGRYYLADVKYTLLEIESHVVPCWRFTWTRFGDQPVSEPDIEGYVFMNGKVQLLVK